MPTLMIACLSFATSLAAAAIADVTYSFNLPRQDLADALRAIGRQASLNIVFVPETVENLVAPAVHGDLAAEEAIVQALAGTKLRIQKTAPTVILIQPPAKASSSDRERHAEGTGEGPGMDVAHGPVLLAQAEPASSSVTDTNRIATSSKSKRPLELEEVVVTGSRLATQGLSTPSPVTILSNEDIQSAAVTSAGELIRDLPLSGARSVTDTAGRFNSGIATVALRGLPAVDTLVLINGRRVMAADGAGDVDLNSVPYEAIDRIEILQDGASAVYGADAIAGVVNLIMKKNYDGLSLGGYYGISGQGDAQLTNFSLTFGKRFDRGGFIAVASRRKQNGYLIADRPCCRDADQRSRGGADLRDPLPVPASVKGLPGAPPDAEFIIKNGVTQARSLNDFRPFNYPFMEPGPNDAFNYFAYESSMSDSTLNNVWFSGHYDLTDRVTAFVELADNRRDSLTFLAPDGFGEVYGDPITLDAKNDYNPFGVPLSVARTIIEQGSANARQQNNKAETRRFVGGLRGQIGNTPQTTWSWELSFNSQRLDQFTFGGNLTSRSRLQEAAGDSDVCRARAVGTPTMAGDGCVPINLLGGPGSITPEMLHFIEVPTFTSTAASLNGLQLNLTGAPLTLPAGPVKVAFGAEYRREHFDQINDAYRNNKEIIFSGATADAHPPVRKVKETYVEFGVPIVQSLDLDLALRYSDFSQFGKTTNPKVGLRWRPFADWLLRASFGKGFRSPTFTEAYGNQTLGFISGAADPCTGSGFASLPGCNGKQAPSVIGVYVLSGGNPHLRPETAENYTLGLVWTPSQLEGLDVTLDAFSIKKKGVIRQVEPNFILEQNATLGLFPGQVTRDANNRLQQVVALIDNLTEQRIRGLDLGAAYTTARSSLGRFAARLDVSYLNQFAVSAAPNAAPTNRVGQYSADLGTVARYRAGSYLRWYGERWSANYSNRFVDGVTNVSGFATPRQHVSSYIQHDVAVNYDFDAGRAHSQVTFGVENLFDRDPPFVEGNFANGFDTGTFNSRGRYYSLRARVDF